MSSTVSANWSYPTSFKLGPGRIKELAGACKNLGMRRPLPITDRGLASMAITQWVAFIVGQTRRAWHFEAIVARRRALSKK